MTGESFFRAAWRLNKVFPVLLGVLLALNVVIFGLLTYVESPQVDRLERRAIEQQARLRQARQVGEKAATPQALYRKGRKDLRKFQNAIPLRTDFTTLIKELFSLAKGAGLDINRITYEPKEEPKQGMLRYALVFSVSGQYGQIKKFIFSLEQSKRLIAIEKLSLNSGRDSEGEKVSLSLRLSTYFRTGGK